MRTQTARETDSNNNAEDTWNREKSKTDVEEIEAEKGFNKNEGWKWRWRKIKKMKRNNLWMPWLSSRFYDSSVLRHSYFLPYPIFFAPSLYLCVQMQEKLSILERLSCSTDGIKVKLFAMTCFCFFLILKLCSHHKLRALKCFQSEVDLLHHLSWWSLMSCFKCLSVSVALVLKWCWACLG